MKKQMLALAAITAMGLSAQAQVFNWSLTTYNGGPGSGSGQLQLNGGVVTSINGTIGGESISLYPYGVFFGNDNVLPLDPYGLSLMVNNYGGINLYDFGAGGAQWSSLLGGGAASFTYTPVPEPSTWVMAGVFGVGAVATVRMRRRQTASV